MTSITDDDVIKTIPTTTTKNNDDDTVVVDTSFNRFVWLNLLFYILNSLATYSIQLGWIDLPNNGDLSDKYQTLVTPFGLSFSIWGLIFLWQLVWVVWQFLPSQRNSEGVIKAWYYYPIMAVLQAGWTFSFSNEIMWLALIFMYGILFTLVRASMSLQTYQKTWKGYLLWQAPFSIQTGWIMAASAVNTNVLPVAYDASTTAKIVVGSLSLVALLVTAFTWLSSYPVDFAIPCVIVWALYGVYAELKAPMTSITEEFTTKQITGVRNGVLAAMILIGVGIILKIVYVFAKQRPAAIQATAAQQEQAPSHTKTNSDQSSEKEVDAEETV
eukprot:CAMPEP_0170877478 /NCGR_PEP_ID=MMETSP0734-20130129/30356_1 /TAXON_ID=186038 /ORGANISM="Fragilariopsis kerguelensis, Strain L26-C5" /LENGTH=327 /DNA_ID=CAMNT_0011259803 /DNA_START=90 /DNA_END=1073 /DNA_ORIENTATION=+